MCVLEPLSKISDDILCSALKELLYQARRKQIESGEAVRIIYISVRYSIRSIQLLRESILAGLNEIKLCSSQSTNEIKCLEHLPKSAPSCNIIIHIILFNSKVHCNLLNVMHGCTIMHRTSYLLLFLQLSDPTCT